MSYNFYDFNIHVCRKHEHQCILNISKQEKKKILFWTLQKCYFGITVKKHTSNFWYLETLNVS